MGRHQTAPVCTRIVGVQPCFSVVVCTKVKCDPPTGAVGAFATSCAHNLSFLHYIGHPLHWLYQWNAAIGITNGDGDSPSSKFINLAGCQDPILHCIALHLLRTFVVAQSFQMRCYCIFIRFELQPSCAFLRLTAKILNRIHLLEIPAILAGPDQSFWSTPHLSKRSRTRSVQVPKQKQNLDF